MDDNMTNEEILAEFEELFGGTEEPPEDPTSNEDEPEESGSDGEGTEPPTNEEEGEEPEDSSKNQRMRQAHAFAAMRTQNKAQEQLIKNLGSLLGFDASATNDAIIAKVQQALTEKQAKEQNIPVEILNRLQDLERQVQETEVVKHEAKVTEDLTALAEKFDLNENALTEFLLKLNEIGKNPLENDNVDLRAEYISMYFDQLMDKAVQTALEGEQNRKDKQGKAPGSLPGKVGNEEQGESIKSVSDLDKVFNSINI